MKSALEILQNYPLYPSLQLQANILFATKHVPFPLHIVSLHTGAGGGFVNEAFFVAIAYYAYAVFSVSFYF